LRQEKADTDVDLMKGKETLLRPPLRYPPRSSRPQYAKSILVTDKKMKKEKRKKKKKEEKKNKKLSLSFTLYQFITHLFPILEETQERYLFTKNDLLPARTGVFLSCPHPALFNLFFLNQGLPN
jgi:hypothetical protein